MSPDDLLYTKEHEWVRLSEDIGVIGITDHAQKQLGDIVYVELPKAGAKFDAGQPFGSVESVKAVSELFLPVSGEVVDINEEAGNSPETINADPYGEGWICVIEPTDAAALDALLDAEGYQRLVQD